MTFEELMDSTPPMQQHALVKGYQAGFAAGAASRDAEVVSLTNQRDYEYVRAENAEQERDQFEQESDQLRAHINVLREALADTLYFLERHSNRWDGINGKHPNEVACTARSALSSTPEQSLAASELRKELDALQADNAELVAALEDNWNCNPCETTRQQKAFDVAQSVLAKVRKP